MRRPKNPTPRAGCEPTQFCCPTLTPNPDGSFTFDRGDGSAPVIIPAPSGPDCCPTLTNNGDGTFTYSQGDGSAPITINTSPPTLNFTGGTLTLTANGASTTAPLRGNLVQDLASIDLGYLLPLT